MNTKSIVSRLLSSIDIQHTDRFISTFLDQNEFPDSPETIIALLENYNIEAMAVKIDTQQLLEVDLPILVIQKSGVGNSSYAILESLAETEVTYWTEETGSITVNPPEFLKSWTGHAVLLDTEDAHDEPNYSKNKSSQGHNVAFKIAGAAFGVLLLAVSITYMFANGILPTALFVINVIGIFVTFQLVNKSIGNTTSITDSICNFSNNTDCEKVLSSSGSKILGLSLSDVGFVYFLITGVFILLAPIYNGLYSLLYDLCILLLPLTLVSIAYQGVKIKSWCPLCLGVSMVIWIQFSILYSLGTGYIPAEIPYLGLVLITGSTILLFTSYKSIWKSSIKGKAITKQFTSFKYDDEVMHSVIEGGRPISSNEYLLSNFHITSGNNDHELIIISDPTCVPCGIMHQELEGFIEEFDSYVSVITVPFFKMSNDLSSDVAQHMINLAASGMESWGEAIHTWYRMDSKDRESFDQWKSSYPNPNNTSLSMEVIQWLKANQLFYTPGFVLNGRLINPEYKLKDIRKYLINKITEDSNVMEEA